jgi:hypothetical protein
MLCMLKHTAKAPCTGTAEEAVGADAEPLLKKTKSDHPVLSPPSGELEALEGEISIMIASMDGTTFPLQVSACAAVHEVKQAIAKVPSHISAV